MCMVLVAYKTEQTTPNFRGDDSFDYLRIPLSLVKKKYTLHGFNSANKTVDYLRIESKTARW